jgi:FkbH-like protein
MTTRRAPGAWSDRMDGSAAPDAQVRASLKSAKALVGQGRHAEAFALLRSEIAPETDFVLQARAASILASIPAGALGLRPLRLAVLASSTVDHLVQILRFWLAVAGIEVDTYIAPYDNVDQTVLDPASPLYAFNPQIVWLFTTHRDVNLEVAPGASQVQVQAVAGDEVARRAMLWTVLGERLGCLRLQNNADLPADDPFGHMAGAVPWGRRCVLRQYNSMLTAAAPAGVVVFDLEHVAALWGGNRWIDPRHWFHSKHAFSINATGFVASRAASLIGASLGLAKKCLVLDLDNTLWGGVIGDDGLAGIALGAGAAGEAFTAFQRHVKALGQRGIVLAVCSKNDPETARRPFIEHPDMVLRLQDIAVFRAAWTDKASGIRDIATTLGLGLDAVVFVDDNPVERDLVRQHLPSVQVLEMPDDPALFVETLARAGCFESTVFSAEDRVRGIAYASNVQREALRGESVDLAGYLRSLRMEAKVGDGSDMNLPRIAQLINKSNQFHLTGRRVLEPELLALRDRADHRIVCFRLTDRFGDNGLISALILRRAGEALHIDVWVMSCRVLGRSMEEFIANEVLRVACEWQCRGIVGYYVASARNMLVAGLYERLGFEPTRDGNWWFAADGSRPAWATQIRGSVDRIPVAEPQQ